ncbi:MAG: hypothetical protein WAL94_07955 [Bacteroidales bacterium]
MKRPLYILLSFFLFSIGFVLSCHQSSAICPAAGSEIDKQDTLEKQILYNGRVWRNLYQQIDGSQFLFSDEFLSGSVTINGRTFDGNNLKFKLDIVNDELLILTDRNTILQLNKEMVDLFTLAYENKLFRFKRLEADSLNRLSGYLNVIYNGETSLYVKYKKEIRLRNSAGEKDTFIQSHRVYVMKDGILHTVNNKASLMKLLSDRKEQLRDFIRSNKIRISRNNPESIAPVLAFYDNFE